jgi:hypothetical protein
VYQQENAQDSVDVLSSDFALGASADGIDIH